ncbi:MULTISPECIES: hypothetical protein [Oligella]|uniref:Uncharacterized protein n=2 Tax=Oligella urethralis TaxID=90245 RepID=A0A096BCS0_9BURK|nr:MULTISPECIES: hypothetical protein [Oligella]AVL70472.1 hypothetical protein CEQ07_02890 [Oligella urethralis]KGF30979.1 hypothetical protein HMPREF2130_05105 [Oligella urethralis DNF00040]MDK6203514.1 hypothetical protein [Oligella urethralis]OFS83855.1 hypothetical protein HMPREF3144_08550 [Oligella sp. HMSC05A10]OFV50015.1 hypothetical protein HMPREF3179_03360 [Oligella sp. HMSC09E12]
MAVVLSMIAKGLYIIGGVTVFFAILCLSTLNAKPNAKNQALLAQLSPEQIAQGKKNARNAIIYIFLLGLILALIGYVLSVFSGRL